MTDDDVLETTGDGHVALVVDDPEVATAEVALVVERVGVERWVEVARDDLGALQSDLPLDPGAGPGAVEGDHDQLHPGGRPSLGVGQLLVGVECGGHHDDGGLGQAVARHDADSADLVLEVVVELRRLRCPTPRIRPHGRKDRLSACGPLGGQVGQVERGARTSQGDAVGGQELGGPRRMEGLGGEQGAPGEQRRDQPADAADVCEGEHQGGHIIGPHVEALGHGQRRSRHREVGVGRALRVGGRARGVEEPPYGGIVRRGRGRHECGQHRRVAVGECSVDDEHRQAGPLGCELMGHGLEVEAPVDRGHDEQCSLALGGDEAHLAIPVDRDERVLACPEPAQRPDQHERFVPGGEFPADIGPDGHPVLSEQTSCCPQAGVTVGREGHLVASVFMGQHGIGGRRGACLDETPQGGGELPAPGCSPLLHLLQLVIVHGVRAPDVGTGAGTSEGTSGRMASAVVVGNRRVGHDHSWSV